MESFLANAGHYIQSAPWLGVAAVFLGGVISSAAPCVLAIIPLTMSFVAGQAPSSKPALRGFLFSLVFVLGLCVTFAGLGVAAALLGTVYGEVSPVWTWIVAAVCIVMGLHLAGVLPFNIPVLLSSQPRLRGAAGAFVMGLLFGVVSAPCAAPILVVLLTYLAGTGASVAYGAGLLLVYALGHSVMILLAGTSMGLARKMVESRGLSRASGLMKRAAGVVIVCVGIYFVYSGLA